MKTIQLTSQDSNKVQVSAMGATEGACRATGVAAEGTGRKGDGRRSISRHPLAGGPPVPEQTQLMERVVERSNMQAAYRRVKRNKGAPGAKSTIRFQIATLISSGAFQRWRRYEGLERY